MVAASCRTFRQRILLVSLLLADKAYEAASKRQAPDAAEVAAACYFAYGLKLDMPGSNHHIIRASDFQRKLESFDSNLGSPAPLLEAYWILALPAHFQEAVLKECPAMVALSYLLVAESKLYVDPGQSSELFETAASIIGRIEKRAADLIRQSWPIDAAAAKIREVHSSITRLHSKPLPAAGPLDVILAHCKEDMAWFRKALPRWMPGSARVFIYEKCGQLTDLGDMGPAVKVLHVPVEDGPPGGRKDECSAYLTHLANVAQSGDVAEYSLFIQADALNHVRAHFLNLVMRSMQLRTLDVPFLHLGQARMVSSISPCKRAIFQQVLGRPQSGMASGYCCAQFLAHRDRVLAPGDMWQRALKAMDEPLPGGCESVRQGAGMHCLVFESIWHVMFGLPEQLSPRAEDVSLPSFLRTPEADGSDLPGGANSTFYFEQAVGDAGDLSWLESVLPEENDVSGARSIGYVGWDGNVNY
eukprot:TRINITY_DN61965_c0_g1_i1.p1 TRINITY_DN61965_c0_g1~~TRINITY_DN61965_c0_g1_i1.p1  ORF type:complete len:479 (+),score=94.10 TRINITY_DN61965_c0_g1_i1:23-1438(+)